MRIPHFNLWHKTLIVCIALLPSILYVSKTVETERFKPHMSWMGRCDFPQTYRIKNADSPDSLTEKIGKQLISFLRSNGLKGGISVAISRGGRLSFAKGFGFSDLQDSSVMEPYNLLRVASVSKLITGVAIMRLVEDGQLFLDQKVFGEHGILNDESYLVFRDRRMRDITIRQLLNHSGGWNSQYGDPMFMPYTIEDGMGCGLPVSMEDIIKYMQGKNLSFTPGTMSVYSNFGFGILGEVVAKASGMPYELYVQSQVLSPLGIYDAHIGYSHECDRFADEVAYYEPDTASRVADYAERGVLSRRAYGGSDIHTLGSAGGWVISSVDLVKLLLAIDGFASVPDLLSQNSIDEMTDPSSRLDPLGWRKVIGGLWFRSGTLSATSAALCRRPDGICFAAVINSSSGSLGPALAIMLANKMNELINKIPEWPEYDLLADDAAWQSYKRMNGTN